jgi:proliferating cell nuclear antigen PCNA
MVETMLFELSNPTQFINLLGCIESIHSEATLIFDERGISVKEMDTQHVALMLLDVPDKMFDEYTYHIGTIPVNLTELLKVLGKITKDDSLRAYYDDTGDIHAAKLRFVLKGHKGLTRNKTVRVLDNIDAEVPMPKIFFKSKTRVLLDPFKYAVEDLSKVSEHIKFSVNDTELTLSASGDLSVESTSFNKGDDNTLEHRVEEHVSSVFSNSYLTDTLKEFKKVSEVVTIELSQDMPIHIEVELRVGSLHFYEAPVIGRG